MEMMATGPRWSDGYRRMLDHDGYRRMLEEKMATGKMAILWRR